MLSKLHSKLLSEAFEKVLSHAESGAVSFVRCLSPDIVRDLAEHNEFSPKGWSVQRVADEEDWDRTISSDQAVEMRENKAEPILFLVDTSLAEAGMDGIYSAAQEIDETRLFKVANGLASKEIDDRAPGESTRADAELTIRTARGYANQFNISPWAVFEAWTSLSRLSWPRCTPKATPGPPRVGGSSMVSGPPEPGWRLRKLFPCSALPVEASVRCTPTATPPSPAATI